MLLAALLLVAAAVGQSAPPAPRPVPVCPETVTVDSPVGASACCVVPARVRGCGPRLVCAGPPRCAGTSSLHWSPPSSGTTLVLSCLGADVLRFEHYREAVPAPHAWREFPGMDLHVDNPRTEAVCR